MTDERQRPAATRWRLLSAVERREREGSSFEIPEAAARASLSPGDGAKLLFELRTGVERMWVVVLERRDGGYLGRLISTPAEENAPVAPGLDLEFRPEHVAAIDQPPIDYLKREVGATFAARVKSVRARGEGD